MIAALDEAGRGPLAGPVVVAAVVVDHGEYRESKQLTPAQRRRAAEQILRSARDWSLAVVGPRIIDRLGILRATLEGMREAVAQLRVPVDEVWVDGNQAPECAQPVRCIPGGDRTVPAIAAASILAKVYRDLLMEVLDLRYPGYGFREHRGYPTPDHFSALRLRGPCPAHRRSFRPVREAWFFGNL